MQTPVLQIIDFEYSIKSQHIFEKHWTKTLWKIPELKIQNEGLTVLAGRNGSGKSTLLRCIMGLIRPTRGKVLWFGRSSFGPADLGYLPEIPIIPPSIKVKQWLKWLTSAEEVEKLLAKSSQNDLMQSLSVEPFLNVPADRLSKGQSQRVLLWGALAHSPKVLMLDEPFSGLDPWAREELSQFICQLIDSGCHIIMSTHELTKSLRNVTSKTWLIEGQLINEHMGCVLPE